MATSDGMITAKREKDGKISLTLPDGLADSIRKELSLIEGIAETLCEVNEDRDSMVTPGNIGTALLYGNWRLRALVELAETEGTLSVK
jgi:hypothetical protein